MKLLRPILLALVILGGGIQVSHAKDVRIGMGNFAPYFIAEGETGVFTDLIRLIFERLPHHEPVFLFGRPNKRLWREFNDGSVDAVANVFDSVEINGCRSEPAFRFRDMAMTRADSNIKLNDITDLAGKSIVTFQGASGFFGEQFAYYASTEVYTEVAKQELQSSMLHGGRADVNVGDLFLFLSSLKRIKDPSATPEAFHYHDIFAPTFSSMGFRDSTLCYDFNEALFEIKRSGEYEAIYEKYLSKLGFE